MYVPLVLFSYVNLFFKEIFHATCKYYCALETCTYKWGFWVTKNDWQASIKLNNGHPCRQLEKMAMCESKKNNFKVTDYNNIKVTHDWY